MLEKNILEHVEKVAKDADKFVTPELKNTHRKYPITAGLISLIGLTAVLSGFDRLYESIPFINEHPILLIAIGLILLATTGTLYKWLHKKDFLQ